MKIELLWCFHQASYVYKCPMLHLFLIFRFDMYILIFINFMSTGKYILKKFHIYFVYIYIFIYFLMIICTFLVNISIFSIFYIQVKIIYIIFYFLSKSFFLLFDLCILIFANLILKTIFISKGDGSSKIGQRWIHKHKLKVINYQEKKQ